MPPAEIPTVHSTGVVGDAARHPTKPAGFAGNPGPSASRGMNNYIGAMRASRPTKEVKMILSKLKKGGGPRIVFEGISLIMGAAVFAAGVSFFISPGKIPVGGFTGISLIVNFLTPVPVGMLVLAMNIPMFIICARVFGLKFIAKTIVGVVAATTLMDAFALFPPVTYDPIMCALFGGLLQGTGLSILYSGGFTTGGSDLVLWLLKLKFPHLSSGFIFFILDSIVVGAAALILRDLRSALFSAIAIFTYTRVLDTLMGSADHAGLVFVISKEHEAISAQISERLRRGVTLLHGTGWYTGDHRHVMMCVVERSQRYTLKQIARAADPEAFIVVADAREVIGRGFKQIEEGK